MRARAMIFRCRCRERLEFAPPRRQVARGAASMRPNNRGNGSAQLATVRLSAQLHNTSNDNPASFRAAPLKGGYLLAGHCFVAAKLLRRLLRARAIVSCRRRRRRLPIQSVLRARAACPAAGS